MKKIKSNDVKQINGGWDDLVVKEDYAKSHEGQHIGQYDASNYIGQRFIADPDDIGCFYEGILINSWEEDMGCGSTQRYHRLREIDGSKDIDLPGTVYTLYLYKE